jgi:carbon storage regulator
MLVLSRKVGERIVLSGGVAVTVTALHRSHVRLAVEAPQDVLVLRQELVGTESLIGEASPRDGRTS